MQLCGNIFPPLSQYRFESKKAHPVFSGKHKNLYSICLLFSDFINKVYVNIKKR